MNVQSEPRNGHRMRGRDGTEWVKDRQLGERAYADALVEALAVVRTGGNLTHRHVEAMGYRLVGGVKP